MSVFEPKQLKLSDVTVFWPREKKPLAEARVANEVRFELVRLRCPSCERGYLNHQDNGEALYIAPDLHICDACGVMIRLPNEEPYPQRREVLVPNGKEKQP